MHQGQAVARYETVKSDGEVLRQVTVGISQAELQQLVHQASLIQRCIISTEVANGLRPATAANTGRVCVDVYTYW